MSRIGSTSSGVRVAAQPLSNVYTVLLLIGVLALVLSLVALWITMDRRYGVVFGVTEPGKQALHEPEAVKDKQASEQAELDRVQEALKQFRFAPLPSGAGATPGGTTPTVGGPPPPSPVTPPPPSPVTPPPPSPVTPPPATPPATPPAPAEPPATPPATPPAPAEPPATPPAAPAPAEPPAAPPAAG